MSSEGEGTDERWPALKRAREREGTVPPSDLAAENARLQAEVEKLRTTVDRLVPYVARTCRTCHGRGSVPGFWYGTIKTCPACHGTARHV